MLVKLGNSSSNNGSTARFDSANVDLINNVVVEHVRDCAIHMNLADGTGTLGLVFQCIRCERWDRDLVSNTVVVVTTPFVLAQVVLMDQSLSLFSESLQVCHNRDRQEYVSLEHETSWQHATGLVDAGSNCTLRRCERSINQAVCFLFVAWIDGLEQRLDCIVNLF